MNITLDRMFSEVSTGTPYKADPRTMDAGALALEFERMAHQMRGVTAPDLPASAGIAHTVRMLDRAAVICRGLAALPNALEAVGRIGRGRR